MRENEEIPKHKAPNEHRVFVLGDSMAFGFGIEKADALSECLQPLLQKSTGKAEVKVFNAAAPGTGPLQYLHVARTLALPLGADSIVLIFYVANDMENTISPYLAYPYALKNHLKVFFPNTYLWTHSWRYNRRLQSHFGPPQNSSADTWDTAESHRWAKWEGTSPEEIDRRITQLSAKGQHWMHENLVDPSAFYAGLSHPNMLSDTAMLKSKGMQWAYERSEAIMGKIHRMCERAGANLILVIAPASYQVGDEQWNFFRQVGYNVDPSKVLRTEPQNRLKSFCEREGIAYLDLLPALKRATPPLYFERDEHWRPTTVGLVAELISDIVTKEKWISED